VSLLSVELCQGGWPRAKGLFFNVTYVRNEQAFRLRSFCAAILIDAAYVPGVVPAISAYFRRSLGHVVVARSNQGAARYNFAHLARCNTVNRFSSEALGSGHIKPAPRRLLAWTVGLRRADCWRNIVSTSLRFPFAYLANKRRKVVIRPGYVS
jgi:hypothetical protein